MFQLDVDNDWLTVELQVCKVLHGYKMFGLIECECRCDERGGILAANRGCKAGQDIVCGGLVGADDEGECWGGLRGEVGVEGEIGSGGGGRGGEMGEKVAEGGGGEGGGELGAGSARAGEVADGRVAQEVGVGEREREQGE